MFIEYQTETVNIEGYRKKQNSNHVKTLEKEWDKMNIDEVGSPDNNRKMKRRSS